MLVYEAVRISSRMPFILPVIRRNHSIYVDGDVFNSFPIDGAKKKIVKRARKGNMIGLLVSPPNKSHQIDDLFDYFNRIIRGMIGRYNNLCAQRYKKYNITIQWNAGFALKLTQDERESLFKQGYQAGINYLEKRGLPSERLTPVQSSVQQTRLSEDPDQPDKEEH
jgi:predicted patatin/cPLA2 family phospholipase